jgi:purine-binding chemotaxis protein CheW
MTPETAPSFADRAGKYLTFAFAQEEYGVPVLKVREIVRMTDITAVPRMPAHVRGVINLRGTVIPVVDLGLTFGFPRQDYTERTCIVIVDVALAATRVMMGVIVDRVAEVLNVTSQDLEPTPEFGGRAQTDSFYGMAKINGRVTILIDLDRVLGADGTVAVPGVA